MSVVIHEVLACSFYIHSSNHLPDRPWGYWTMVNFIVHFNQLLKIHFISQKCHWHDLVAFRCHQVFLEVGRRQLIWVFCIFQVWRKWERINRRRGKKSMMRSKSARCPANLTEISDDKIMTTELWFAKQNHFSLLFRIHCQRLLS